MSAERDDQTALGGGAGLGGRWRSSPVPLAFMIGAGVTRWGRLACVGLGKCAWCHVGALGGAKRPWRMTGGETHCDEGTPQVGQDWGNRERDASWPLGTRGRGFPWSGCEIRNNMDTSLEGGEERREKHLISGGEGGNIGRSDRGETFGREANVGHWFMEERDQVVEVARSRDGRERRWGAVSRGATLHMLVGGHGQVEVQGCKA